MVCYRVFSCSPPCPLVDSRTQQLVAAQNLPLKLLEGTPSSPASSLIVNRCRPPPSPNATFVPSTRILRSARVPSPPHSPNLPFSFLPHPAPSLPLTHPRQQ